VAYAKAVADQLRDAKAMPGNLTKNVEKALDKMRNILEQGEQFW